MSDKGFLRGKVQTLPLVDVLPNPWNANVVPAHVMGSIKHGFQTDGWLVSQSLLVWGKDDKGAQRNLIIDGEHRWRAANDLGMVEGPMVVLDGLTEVEARALTVKMNQKRGDWDADRLGELLRSIEYSAAGDVGLATALGFDEDALAQLLAVEAVVLPTEATDPPMVISPGPANGGIAPGAPGVNVRVAQLVFTDAEHNAFVAMVKQLDTDKQGVTPTVMKALRDACAALEV